MRIFLQWTLMSQYITQYIYIRIQVYIFNRMFCMHVCFFEFLKNFLLIFVSFQKYFLVYVKAFIITIFIQLFSVCLCRLVWLFQFTDMRVAYIYMRICTVFSCLYTDIVYIPLTGFTTVWESLNKCLFPHLFWQCQQMSGL